MKNWFKEHLPMKILKQFPNIDVDNKYKGIGFNIYYDSRFDRVFFTKRDYIVEDTTCLKYDREIGFYTDCDGEETITCPIGYTYNTTTELCEKIFTTEEICPEGYTYNSTTKTCTLVETISATCVCTANVTASDIAICNGETTNIALSSTNTGISFKWIVSQSGVTGASNGTGSTISQTLSGAGTATYTVTPFETTSLCEGTPIQVVATVKAIPNVIATPSSVNVGSGESFTIELSSSMSGTTFNWTVVNSGVTGPTNGSGSTITATTTGEGISTYTVTPTNNGCQGNSINVIVTSSTSGISCGGNLTAAGTAGLYEVSAIVGTATGDVTVTLDSAGVPDRFQIIWNGNIVADSLFVGDSLPDSAMENEIINVTTLNKFLYDGTTSTFTSNGSTSVDFSAADISNSSGNSGTLRNVGSVGNQIGVVPNFPSASAKASDGNIKLRFNKTTALPVDIKIISIGVSSNTAWQLISLECPTN
jgi:hypothetical protein